MRIFFIKMNGYYLDKASKLGKVMDIRWTLTQSDARIFLNEGNVKSQNTILRNNGHDSYIIQTRVVEERFID